MALREHKVVYPRETKAGQGLTRAKRRLIREYRKRLGIDMWTIHDDLLTLRGRHQLGELWNYGEMMEASELVEGLIEVILDVVEGKKITRKDPKTGRKQARVIPGVQKLAADAKIKQQYRTRLKGALKGMTLAIGFFQRIVPEKIEKELEAGGQDELTLQGWFMQNYTDGMKALRAAWTQLFFTTQARDVQQFKLSEDESARFHKYMEKYKVPPPELVMEWEAYVHEQGIVAHIYDSDGEFIFEVMPMWFVGDDPESLKQRASLRQSKKARAQWAYRPKKVAPGKRLLVSELSDVEKGRITQFLKRYPGLPSEEAVALTGVGIHEGEPIVAEAYLHPVQEEPIGAPPEWWEGTVAEWRARVRRGRAAGRGEEFAERSALRGESGYVEPPRGKRAAGKSTARTRPWERASAEEAEEIRRRVMTPNPGADDDDIREDYMLHRAIWTMDLED